MGRAQIQPNPFPRFRCEGNASCGNPAEWVILTPGRAPGQIPICTADVNAIIESLPDALLPAVGALVRRHVLEGTAFGVDLWERFRAMHPGRQSTPPQGEILDIDTPQHLAAAEFMVMRHVTEGTEWGQALVSKIADALPDDGAPVGADTTEADPGGNAYDEAINVDPGFLRPVRMDGTVDFGTGADAMTEDSAPTGHACICGWDPKEGSANPDRDLKAHQRFCEAAKAEKGAD